MSTFHVLMVDSEPRADRDARLRHGRPTASESFIKALQRLCPEISCDCVAPVDGDVATPRRERYSAVLFSGSPLHFYDGSDQVQRVIAFADKVFDTGLPCFGSCAGLQIATVAAGGVVGPKEHQTELGIARGVVATDAGKQHPMLQGRPCSFDATSIHGDEVKELPKGATLLATSAKTKVQAAELRVRNSSFWGVQYHPEISLTEVAAALGDDATSAIGQGFAKSKLELELYLERLETLDHHPWQKGLSWQLGLDQQVTDFKARTAELNNFLRTFVTSKMPLAIAKA